MRMAPKTDKAVVWAATVAFLLWFWAGSILILKELFW